MGKDVLKRMNVAAALMGVDLPEEPVASEVDRIVEEDRRLRERRAKLRRMKPWQRRKYERDTRRTRVTIYLPAPLLEAVLEMARHELVPPSSAVTWLIAVGFKEWKRGISTPQVVEARSLRVESSLSVPEKWNGKRKRRTFDLPEVIEAVQAVSQAYGCGRSDAATWLIGVGVDRYEEGLSPVREPSKDVRYAFRLKLPRGWKARDTEEEKASPADVLRRYVDSI